MDALENNDSNDNAAEVARARAARSSLRVRLLRSFGVILAILAIGYAVYWFTTGANFVSTDNAYVGAELAQITPLVSGNVKAVHVSDTQTVKAGDRLVELDPADAAINVASARANLDRTIRTIRQAFANNLALEKTVSARAIDLQRAQSDLRRRISLKAGGDIAAEELAHNQDAVAAASAALETAKAQLEAGRTITSGYTFDNHPDVLRAKATLDQARLDGGRTTLVSPIDGVVSRRNVQVGQRVSAGTALMTVVPLNKVYVDANFKEVQLKKVRPGQSVRLISDLYGDSHVFHGHVAGFSGGTGAAFALIPAQNATGNWIKVVQRVPVRITLDPKDLAGFPLVVGLSMKATIDLHPQDKGKGPDATPSNQAGV